MPFSLQEIRDWTAGTWSKEFSGSIQRIIHDSRAVQPGDMYVAIAGDRLDGHDFIPQALEQGAIAVLAQRMTEHEIPHCIVKSSTDALLACAKGYRKKLSTVIIGITGSVGKTTIKEILAEILSEAAPTSKTRGNWNNEIGFPLCMLSVKPDDKFAVLEIGMSHPGDLEPLSEALNPDLAIISAVGLAHAEFFHSEKEIAIEKSTLLQHLKPNGFAVIDNQSPWFELFSKANNGTDLEVAMDHDAEYIGCYNGTELEIKQGDETERYALSLPGKHMAENTLKAIAVAKKLGLNSAQIRKGLAKFKSIDMRWDKQTLGGFHFINDAYNANPVSMKASIHTFEELDVSGADKWLVIGSMLELGDLCESEHKALGLLVSKGAWNGVVITGEMSQFIAKGFEAVEESCSFVEIKEKTEIADYLKKHCEPGAYILLKASRGDQLEEILRYF